MQKNRTKSLVDFLSPKIPWNQLQRVCLTVTNMKQFDRQILKVYIKMKAAKQMNVSRETFGNILAMGITK